jgi:hypothetical protein
MPVSKLRLGLSRAGFFENLDPEYGKAVEAAIDALRKLTASVTQVNLPRAVAAPVIRGAGDLRVSREVGSPHRYL